jgi:hypothetical protein
VPNISGSPVRRQRGQRLQAQDVPAQGQAEKLRRDEGAALGRLLIAQVGNRIGDQLAEYGLEFLSWWGVRLFKRV